MPVLYHGVKTLLCQSRNGTKNYTKNKVTEGSGMAATIAAAVLSSDSHRTKALLLWRSTSTITDITHVLDRGIRRHRGIQHIQTRIH